MEFDFKGKNVVITGGNSGIGFAAAKAFAQNGANVAICGTNKVKLDKAVEKLKEFETWIYGGVCNVGDSAQLLKFADDCEAVLGGIDIWISNAGFMPSSKIVDTSEELWNDLFNINVKSVYIGAKIAKEKMVKGGVLINASSFASIMPSVNTGVYAATKAAVTSLTKTLSSELAPFGIRVVGYIPGLIATDLNAINIENNGNKLLESISARKFGTAEDIANGILFLASDYASYITGTCLEISGGKFATQNPKAAWEL